MNFYLQIVSISFRELGGWKKIQRQFNIFRWCDLNLVCWLFDFTMRYIWNFEDIIPHPPWIIESLFFVRKSFLSATSTQNWFVSDLQPLIASNSGMKCFCFRNGKAVKVQRALASDITPRPDVIILWHAVFLQSEMMVDKETTGLSLFELTRIRTWAGRSYLDWGNSHRSHFSHYFALWWSANFSR